MMKDDSLPFIHHSSLIIKKAARLSKHAALFVYAVRRLLLALDDGELLRGRERLARNLVTDAYHHFVFAGGEGRGRKQACERQALARVRKPAPVLRLLEYFLAVLRENVLDIHGRTQRRLVDASVVDLHVYAHVLPALVRA